MTWKPSLRSRWFNGFLVGNNPVNFIDPKGLLIIGAISQGVKGGFSTKGTNQVVGTIIGSTFVGTLGAATGVPGLAFQGSIAGGIVGGEIGKQFDKKPNDSIQDLMDKDTDGDGSNDYFDDDHNNNGIPDVVDKLINDIDECK